MELTTPATQPWRNHHHPKLVNGLSFKTNPHPSSLWNNSPLLCLLDLNPRLSWVWSLCFWYKVMVPNFSKINLAQERLNVMDVNNPRRAIFPTSMLVTLASKPSLICGFVVANASILEGGGEHVWHSPGDSPSNVGGLRLKSHSKWLQILSQISVLMLLWPSLYLHA